MPSRFQLSIMRSRGLSMAKSKLHRQRLKQLVYLAVAVGKRVEPDADFVEQGQVEIGERFGFVVFDVAVAFHAEGGAAGDEDRQVCVVVDVRIADATAV